MLVNECNLKEGQIVSSLMYRNKIIKRIIEKCKTFAKVSLVSSIDKNLEEVAVISFDINNIKLIDNIFRFGATTSNVQITYDLNKALAISQLLKWDRKPTDCYVSNDEERFMSGTMLKSKTIVTVLPCEDSKLKTTKFYIDQNCERWLYAVPCESYHHNTRSN